MRTFHGHEEDAGGDFDVGSIPHARRGRSSTAGFDPRPRRAPPEPKLGRWVFPARSVEASQPAISATVAHACHLVPAHQTKSALIVRIDLGAHANSCAVVRSESDEIAVSRVPVRQPESNLAQLCSTRAGFKMRYYSHALEQSGATSSEPTRSYPSPGPGKVGSHLAS